MKKGINLPVLWAVIIYVILSFLPSLAMAAEMATPFPSFPNGFIGNPAISSPTSFIIPIQKAGRLEVPVVKKPWYKKGWVWTIGGAILVGIAASSQGQDAQPVKPVPVAE